MTTGQQARSNPLKVIVLSPPIDRSGGIGTLFRYARENFPPEVDVEFIDTRGYSKNPWSSLITLLRALLLVTWRRISRNVDVIHLNLGARGAAIRKLTLATWITFVLRTPFVLQLHAATFGDFTESLPRPILKLMIALMNRSERILVLGTVWRNLLIRLGCEANKVQVFVMGVPRLVDSPVITQPDLQTKLPEYRTLLFAGELGERKGLPHLIRALTDPRIQNTKLVVAGAGDLAPWKNMIQEHKLQSRVSLLGLVPISLVHDILTKVDGLILPSRAEGLPVSVLEGLSAGKVVLTTESGSLSEFIQDGVSAIVIEGQEDGAIVEAVLRAFTGINSGKIAENAYALWQEKFDAENTTKALMQVWSAASIA